jgi:hypothetical protein
MIHISIPDTLLRIAVVDHYYLEIDAVTQPMQVQEEEMRYGNGDK